MSDALKMHDAMVALLDKLDVVEKAISGMFVLAHVHGMPYNGPNYKEEYDRCRELTGTTRNEVLDEPPPENPAMFWFLDVENQEYLQKWAGQHVAVVETDHGFDVVASSLDLNVLLTRFYQKFGEVEPVYFGYVNPPTITTVASTISSTVDNTGATCTECGEGTYQETGVQDDMHGVLHCSECRHQVERWV